MDLLLGPQDIFILAHTLFKNGGLTKCCNTIITSLRFKAKCKGDIMAF